MKYYESHDWAYQNCLSKGHVMWDKGAYEEPYSRGFVERLLKQSAWLHERARILVLGCGTGPLACILAAKGYRVTGVDISVTAIEFARKQAAERKLDVAFLVADACQPVVDPGTQDLVIDDHLLHCIILPQDRKRTLTAVHVALRPGGEFWVETMVNHPSTVPPEAWGMDAEGVCWSKVPEWMRTPECVERGGTLWLPTRIIRTHPEQILEELSGANFEPLWQEVEAPTKPDEPAKLRVRCRRG